ncbi:MAG: ATP-binding cassette domain-containing protein, partial [Acidimicrobiia bacterium]|nr:ATP-binding cassette domain-containing protein [Acidimicrobiia bacterium]
MRAAISQDSAAARPAPTDTCIAGAGAVPAKIRIQGVSKTYRTKRGEVVALQDIDLTVAPNEFVTLVGPSGCGKSTVLRCFNRMNDLIETARVEGSIRYHGVDLYDPKVDPVEVRRRIGYLPEHPPLYPEMTVAGFLRFVARIKGVPRGDLEAETARVMEKV